jgi:hypothetical protein
MTNWKAKIAVIRECTENNDHTGAYILGCDLLTELGCEISDIREGFVNVAYNMELVGYLSNEMNEKRFKLWTKLKTAARALLGDDLYNEFYRSF